MPVYSLKQAFSLNSEPTKINEDDHLEMTRRDKTEGAIMAVQSGLFKLLLPLPNVPEASLAKRMAPKEEDSAVLFLLHPKQPLSLIAVSKQVPLVSSVICV